MKNRYKIQTFLRKCIRKALTSHLVGSCNPGHRTPTEGDIWKDVSSRSKKCYIRILELTSKVAKYKNTFTGEAGIIKLVKGKMPQEFFYVDVPSTICIGPWTLYFVSMEGSDARFTLKETIK